MKKIIGVIVALIAVAALVAVVLAMQKDDTTDTNGNNSTSNSENATDSPATSEETDAEEKATAVDQVTIEDFAFSPEAITVKKGTTVTWTNKDSVEHTVTGDEGGPDSELFGQGESYSYTFNEVGTFTYFCKPHPNMTGKVIVQE